MKVVTGKLPPFIPGNIAAPVLPVILPHPYGCVYVASQWGQEGSSWKLWPPPTKFCSLLCHGRASQEGQVKNPNNKKKSFKSTTFYLSQHLPEPGLLLTWLCLCQTWQQEEIYTSNILSLKLLKLKPWDRGKNLFPAVFLSIYISIYWQSISFCLRLSLDISYLILLF